MPKADHAITQLNMFNISPYFMQNEGVNGYNSTICYASLHLLSQFTQIYIVLSFKTNSFIPPARSSTIVIRIELYCKTIVCLLKIAGNFC